ncbi:hypothetical protein AXK56_12155 [Tsukamurella pulmonis]|uniref:Uncharacterized protein n=2 Tax=Tsukamurella pulmonis TaxID=47312 RepID=A0A1H1H0W8_9ACTN|nr:hypothetical protein [Tsukamurella pulmonis]KXO88121.1 hypothetical protein AXK56_12155 [Tsukamurella pulmonis]SDR19019.1 hypothetical protein SAMN04489765_3721 [Tsukamurella pulmonis]SUP16203.1 Uncharacterised protein [Tsukamurella pulmonis]
MTTTITISDRLSPAFTAMAAGRIAWGAAAVLAPRTNLRVAGAPSLGAPHTDYLIGVFGVRALAIGLGYVTGDAATRARWRRLGLLIDVVDTVNGLARFAAADDAQSRRAGRLMVAITGAYATVGLADAAAGLARSRQARRGRSDRAA